MSPGQVGSRSGRVRPIKPVWTGQADQPINTKFKSSPRAGAARETASGLQKFLQKFPKILLSDFESLTNLVQIFNGGELDFTSIGTLIAPPPHAPPATETRMTPSDSERHQQHDGAGGVENRSTIENNLRFSRGGAKKSRYFDSKMNTMPGKSFVFEFNKQCHIVSESNRSVRFFKWVAVAPPPSAEEETVKEVLSETPKPKAPIFIPQEEEKKKTQIKTGLKSPVNFIEERDEEEVTRHKSVQISSKVRVKEPGRGKVSDPKLEQSPGRRNGVVNGGSSVRLVQTGNPRETCVKARPSKEGSRARLDPRESGKPKKWSSSMILLLQRPP
ncbi:hypothetical protein F3Y22_tig00110556pilonHSYRG00161 [Hibiscus syriacus]|uniref:Uncharacterized protein n=1 Tax=Hibiscus syriacus TaxID=106335 RepID=A0A6A3A9C2_HIBSY|nr:hypothetical protein F3Y22_tig00110556pilonHSYRG00161 [Hibiscus syriacus]